jgi:hypothetical protein
MAITSSGPGCAYIYVQSKMFREIAMKTVMPEVAMKRVIITAAVIGTLLFGTCTLLFALAATSTDQQHHYAAYNSARHHASLPPVW